MRNVWILNHYAQTPSAPGGTRHFSIARHLLEHGWRSTIIAASVDANTARQRLEPGERYRVDDCEGINVLWVRTPAYEGNGSARTINMLTYSWRVLSRSITSSLPEPDVVIGSSVHPFAAFSGAILARRFRVPFVFEVRDLWPQTLIDMGRLRPGQPATRVLSWLERWLYRRADRIVTLLPRAGDYIQPLGIPENKILWIPNGVELQNYPEPQPIKPSDVFTLMYFGAHGQANGLDNVIRAMALLGGQPNASHMRLVMIGSGPLKLQLMQMAQDLDVHNITFLEPVPKVQIPEVAATADAFVICVLDKPNLYRFGISMNKLFDYMAAARPVVTSCDAVNNPVAEAGSGYVVPPENPQALAEAIVKLASLSAPERAAMGRAGRAFVEANHAYSKLAAKLARALDEVVAAPR